MFRHLLWTCCPSPSMALTYIAAPFLYSRMERGVLTMDFIWVTISLDSLWQMDLGLANKENILLSVTQISIPWGGGKLLFNLETVLSRPASLSCSSSLCLSVDRWLLMHNICPHTPALTSPPTSQCCPPLWSTEETYLFLLASFFFAPQSPTLGLVIPPLSPSWTSLSSGPSGDTFFCLSGKVSLKPISPLSRRLSWSTTGERFSFQLMADFQSRPGPVPPRSDPELPLLCMPAIIFTPSTPCWKNCHSLLISTSGFFFSSYLLESSFRL